MITFKKQFLAPLVSLISILIFSGTLQNGFVWDDIRNFIDNPVIASFSMKNIIWFFSSTQYENYFPLVWISVAFDHLLWGLKPFGYHMSNIFFHALVSGLFFILCFKVAHICGASGFPLYFCSFFTSLFYAVHPLRVETVSWISTRGDLLCAIFLQISLICYISRYNSNPDTTALSANQKRARSLLVFSVFFCFLSFLCRAWAIAFPCVLLLIDFGFGRLRVSGIKNSLLEKIPFFILSFIFGIIAFYAKRTGMPSSTDFGPAERILLALRNLSFYLFTTVFPTNLSPLYPINSFVPFSTETIFMSLFSLCIVVLLIWKAKSYPFAFVSFFSYAFLLLPISGLTISGIQSSADRYTYIATMPLYIAFCVFTAKFADFKSQSAANNAWWNFLSKIFATCLFPAIFFLLAKTSINQIGVWKNDLTLWNRVIESGNACYSAYYNRGLFYVRQAQLAKMNKEKNALLSASIRDFSTALKLSPRDTNAALNRGKVFIEKGNFDEAIADFNMILEKEPCNTGALSNRAFAFEKKGEFHLAITDISKILEHNPEDSNAAFRLASLYMKLNELEKAGNVLSAFIELNPSCATAYLNRGSIRLMKNEFEAAEKDFRKALSLSPNMPEAVHNLSIIEKEQ